MIVKCPENCTKIRNYVWVNVQIVFFSKTNNLQIVLEEGKLYFIPLHLQKKTYEIIDDLCKKVLL
ncbi:MAG: hypothetical protein DRJ05_04895 [Bacteroidetes bacterium]|nr:MAG: hypothetical protein DRJ05_04895 [Bacteroidota bacterium]